MKTAKEKLDALRATFNAFGVDGFIVPRADEYQGEFAAPYAERLKWLTGFSGSAGAAVILKDQAVVMSDGRYTIQLKQQTDPALYQTADSTQISAGEWIAGHAPKGATIGYDAWLHTPGQIERLAQAGAAHGIQFTALDENLIDKIWADQPARPQGKALVFPEQIAGKSFAVKKAEIAQNLAKEGVLASVIAMPDSVSWLLNVRGADLDHMPAVLSYALVYADNRPLDWIVDPAKLSEDVKAHLGPDARIIAPSDMLAELKALAQESVASGQAIGLDHGVTPLVFKTAIEAAGGHTKHTKDPCAAPRARKTPQEQAAIKQAHIQDGAALVKFLHWIDENGANGQISELDVENRLLAFRQQNPAFKEPSFATIAGFAENGAIVHYRADAATNKTLQAGSLLLLDSGGQYAQGSHWGTTDVTRTIPIGTPSADMKTHFTLVLKGHFGVATSRFPHGTTGAQIDILARMPLWQQGLDYAHGTGHGVGCYLGVHEEAASISGRSHAAFEPGMLISNEPGFYKEGAYGIRIENLVLVKEGGLCQSTGRLMLEFETVTLAPFDRRLIDVAALSPEQKQWVDAYHEKVYATLSPLLEEKPRNWLKDMTAAL